MLSSIVSAIEALQNLSIASRQKIWNSVPPLRSYFFWMHLSSPPYLRYHTSYWKVFIVSTSLCGVLGLHYWMDCNVWKFKINHAILSESFIGFVSGNPSIPMIPRMIHYYLEGHTVSDILLAAFRTEDDRNIFKKCNNSDEMFARIFSDTTYFLLQYITNQRYSNSDSTNRLMWLQMWAHDPWRPYKQCVRLHVSCYFAEF